MPFKSKAQRRKFHAMADRGEISHKKVKEWEKHTPEKELPEKVSMAAFVDELQKIAFDTSAYSGPLGYGGFQQASHIPAFRSPRLKTAGPPGDKEKEKKAYDPSPIKGPGQLGNVDMPGMRKMQTPAKQLQESKQVALAKPTKPDANKAFNFKFAPRITT